MPKNFRSIPHLLVERIAELGSAPFRLGIVKRIPLQEITAGSWAHIGIEMRDGNVAINSPMIPNPENGKTSHFNTHGRTVIRRDLPKENRLIDLGDRPVYGDWSKGSFDLSVNRPCYPRQGIPAPKISIELKLLETEESDFGVLVVHVCAGRSHRQNGEVSDTDVLHDINLIQENVGSVDVMATNATNDDLLRRVYVNWEILPPGTRDATLAQILNRYRPRNDEERRILVERYQQLAQYEPAKWIVGLNSFAGYFGASIAGRVILENMRPGNALFISLDPDEWVQLSQHSRTELLKNYSHKITRIVHTHGWQDRLAQILAS